MRFFTIFIILTLGVLFSPAQNKKPQSIADIDSLVNLKYKSYEPRRKVLNTRFEAEVDSVSRAKISAEWYALEARCNGEIVKIFADNIGVETSRVLERLYAVRGLVAKTQMERYLKKVPSDVLMSSPYARSLRQYIDTRQVGVGDTVADFKARMIGGAEFRFGELTSLKDVLLVFAGPDFLTSDVNMILQMLYKKSDLSKIEIVSVFPQGDKKSFENAARKTGVSWLSITDFRGDHSPIKIAFDVQVTPKFVYIGKGGAIKATSEGISDEIIALVAEQSYKQQ